MKITSKCIIIPVSLPASWHILQTESDDDVDETGVAGNNTLSLLGGLTESSVPRFSDPLPDDDWKLISDKQ